MTHTPASGRPKYDYLPSLRELRAWRPVETAPRDRAVEIKIVDGIGEREVRNVPYRLTEAGFRHAVTGAALADGITVIGWRDKAW